MVFVPLLGNEPLSFKLVHIHNEPIHHTKIICRAATMKHFRPINVQ